MYLQMCVWSKATLYHKLPKATPPPPHPTPSNIKELWPLINPESSDLPKETSPSQPLSENSETKVKWYIYFPINSQVKVRDLDFRQSTTSVFLGLYYRRVQLSIYHFIQHVGLKSLFIKRLQNFIQLNYSSCLKEMFTVRSPSYNLRDNVRSALFPYVASKIWNSLSDTYKTSDFLQFKQEILKYEAFDLVISFSACIILYLVWK